jgi:hypothetical protein
MSHATVRDRIIANASTGYLIANVTHRDQITTHTQNTSEGPDMITSHDAWMALISTCVICSFNSLVVLLYRNYMTSRTKKITTTERDKIDLNKTCWIIHVLNLLEIAVLWNVTRDISPYVYNSHAAKIMTFLYVTNQLAVYALIFYDICWKGASDQLKFDDEKDIWERFDSLLNRTNVISKCVSYVAVFTSRPSPLSIFITAVGVLSTICNRWTMCVIEYNRDIRSVTTDVIHTKRTRGV